MQGLSHFFSLFNFLVVADLVSYSIRSGFFFIVFLCKHDSSLSLWLQICFRSNFKFLIFVSFTFLLFGSGSYRHPCDLRHHWRQVTPFSAMVSMSLTMTEPSASRHGTSRKFRQFLPSHTRSLPLLDLCQLEQVGGILIAILQR